MMKSTYFWFFGLSIVFAAGLFLGAANADWSEDFSAPLTNWDAYEFDIGETYGVGNAISWDVSGGTLNFDAQLPQPSQPAGGLGGANQAAGYVAWLLDDPAFPDAEDVEISCKIELDGTTEELYCGILARAQNVQPVAGQILVGGDAYVYLISGYDHYSGGTQTGWAEAGLYKLHNSESNHLGSLIRLDETFGDRVDDEPMYMKMKVTTNEYGEPHIQAMMSFSPSFSDPFGVIDYVDTAPGEDGPQIVGPGQIGLIGYNDSDPGPALPAAATFDDLVIITEFLNWGDANGDGYVNSADLDIVRGHWGTSVTPGDAAAGDLSGDGMVNSADLDLIRANWGNVYAAAAVPEPGICVLAAFGLMILGFRLKRQ